MFLRRFFALGMLPFFLFIAVCSGFAQETPSVMVSIAPQKYFLERIAADTVKVTVLVNEGADPHSFEPSPSQMRAASRARLYFTAGIVFENAWLMKVRGVSPDMRVVSLADPLKLGLSGGSSSKGRVQGRHGTEDHQHGHHADKTGHPSLNGHDHGEHLWLSPTAVRKMLPLIVEALVEVQPQYQDMYRNNAADFDRDLADMDAEFTRLFAPVPEERRGFMTFHPAWGNFAADYGLREVAVEVDGKEPTPRMLMNLADFARDNQIRVIFIEPQFPKAMANNLANSVGAEVVIVNPLDVNWMSALNHFALELARSMR